MIMQQLQLCCLGLLRQGQCQDSTLPRTYWGLHSRRKFTGGPQKLPLWFPFFSFSTILHSKSKSKGNEWKSPLAFSLFSCLRQAQRRKGQVKSWWWPMTPGEVMSREGEGPMRKRANSDILTKGTSPHGPCATSNLEQIINFTWLPMTTRSCRISRFTSASSSVSGLNTTTVLVSS